MVFWRCLVAVMTLLAAVPLAAEDTKALQEWLNSPVRPAMCEQEDERTQVLVLGMYHMANPGADVFNLEADDVLAPARQEQVVAVVDGLARFGPDRVAVEAGWESDGLAQAYAEYVAGRAELSRNETQQIGFRLARQLGHERVYGIDAPGEFDLSGIQAIAMNDPEHGARLGRMQALGGAVMSMMAQWLAEGTVGDMLRHMNNPDLLARSHQLYIDILARVVSGTDYAGPDLVGDWYARNLRIFANLDRVSEPGEKVLVVYGQGHATILRELVTSAEDMCLVDPLDYLP